MPFRLGTRISLAHASLVAGLATTGAFVFLIAAERGLDAEMTARSRAVASTAKLHLDDSWLDPLQKRSAAVQAIADARLADVSAASGATRIVLLDGEGRVLATSDARIPHGERFAGLALDSFEFEKAREKGFAASAPYHDGERGWFQSAWVPVGGSAVLGAELAVAYRGGLERLRRAVLLFAVVGVALSVAIGAALARTITGPLARLSEAMRRPGPDGLPPPAGVRGSDEVGELGRRFDELTEALRRHDAELRALSATVAHEVRNPLGAMSGWAELIARRTPDPETRKMTEGIREEIATLERLVGRFLAFAGDQRLRRANADLGAVLDDALRVGVPPGSGVTLRATYGHPTVECDPDALREVFINLVRNGAQAAGRSGTVEVAAVEDPSSVEVRIRDDGPGIPEEVKHRLFQPFATTKADGTGLGLAISRRIVTGHGGSLSYETGATGTTFIVRIPKSRAA